MNFSAYECEHDLQKSVLLSELGEELEAATTIDKIFIILSKKYASFLNYEIYQAMIQEYGINERPREVKLSSVSKRLC